MLIVCFNERKKKIEGKKVMGKIIYIHIYIERERGGGMGERDVFF